MIELLTTTIGLGIAGLDPVGALIAIAALGNGARERNVVIYGFVMILVTVALGMTLSLIVGTRLASLDLSFLDAQEGVWAIGEALVGLTLLGWGIRRLLHPPTHEQNSRSHGIGLYALIGVGLLYGLGSVLDPTFIAVVIFAGREGAILDVGVAHLLWILISQLPLVIVTVVLISGKNHGVIDRLRDWWTKSRPVVSAIGTAAVLLTALFFLADVGLWVATGEFMVTF